MKNERRSDDRRRQQLVEFAAKLKTLSELELNTLCQLVRRGRVKLDEDWEQIVKKIALRHANKIRKKQKN